ncbi:hypothetical protein J6590_076191 [Homalodisca vitripennis]|nr:hypothetical protein J6590_076191 [Homalodisca vitripennis]
MRLGRSQLWGTTRLPWQPLRSARPTALPIASLPFPHRHQYCINGKVKDEPPSGWERYHYSSVVHPPANHIGLAKTDRNSIAPIYRSRPVYVVPGFTIHDDIVVCVGLLNSPYMTMSSLEVSGDRKKGVKQMDWNCETCQGRKTRSSERPPRHLFVTPAATALECSHASLVRPDFVIYNLQLSFPRNPPSPPSLCWQNRIPNRWESHDSSVVGQDSEFIGCDILESRFFHFSNIFLRYFVPIKLEDLERDLRSGKYRSEMSLSVEIMPKFKFRSREHS